MKNERSSNASDSFFGHEFQICAGIVLFFDNLNSIKSLKIEGNDEDIEIVNENGKIYAQAKSYTKLGGDVNAKKKLVAALKTLKKAETNDDKAYKLIYVTNIENTFGNESNTKLVSNKIYKYEDLSEEDQRIIKNIDREFPFEKFTIRTIEFSGDGDTKYNSVMKTVENFLVEAINDSSHRKIVFNNLKALFESNSCDKPDRANRKLLEKKKIVYQIYVATEHDLSEEELDSIDVLDDEILNKYHELIDKEIINFDFSSQIIAKYTITRNRNLRQRDSIVEFINNNYSDFLNTFESIDNMEERKELIKYIMYRIITNRKRLDGIKGAANI